MSSPLAVIDLNSDKMTDVMKKFQDTGAWNLPVVKNGCYYGFVSKSIILITQENDYIDVRCDQ